MLGDFVRVSKAEVALGRAYGSSLASAHLKSNIAVNEVDK
jgi:hypothetical protein